MSEHTLHNNDWIQATVDVTASVIKIRQGSDDILLDKDGAADLRDLLNKISITETIRRNTIKDV